MKLLANDYRAVFVGKAGRQEEAEKPPLRGKAQRKINDQDY
jgi:hypothetical protein